MDEVRLEEMPYEKIAMAGGEMPTGLDYPDQILFMQLRLLYSSYKFGLADREQARREKVELLREYKAHQIVEANGKRWVERIKATELARSAYRKNRTLENADALVTAIDGAPVVAR